jgi:hypothetical protein
MAKRLYYRLYWSAETPIPQEREMNRYNQVRDGAGAKGAVIGTLGTGTKLMVDMAEQDVGWMRIISVNGHYPVPVNWQEILEEKGRPVQDWEWWVDVSALQPVLQPGSDLVLEITVHPDLSYEVRKK